MNSLLYLLWLRSKAFIRKIYSKPVSAILTTLGLLFFVGMAIMMTFSGALVLNKGPFEVFVAVFIGFGLFMMSTMFFQKRTSLISDVDAGYLLVAPFQQRDVIMYAILYSLSGAILFSFMHYFYGVFFFGPLFDLRRLDYVTFLVVSLLMYYTMFCFIDLIYVRFMHSPYQVWMKRGFILLVGALIVFIFGYYYVLNPGVSIEEIGIRFVSSELFDYIPFLGTCRAFLVAFHYGNYGMGILYFGILFGFAFIVTYFTIHTKELDPELIIEDAMWYGELKRKNREAQSNLNLNLKVHAVNRVRWKTKANAISSRLFLDMRKTNSFITKQEIMFIVMYLCISLFNGFDFMFYARYVTIVLFVITMSSNYNDELKHHYLYLIPDAPIKKLIALLVPTVIKLFLVIAVMLLGGLILKPTWTDFVLAFAELLGYAILFVSMNIWSLRILKSNNNQVANQFLKMLIIFLAMIPSIICGVLFGFLFNMVLFSLFSSIINILVAAVFIYASIGIVNGSDLISE